MDRRLRALNYPHTEAFDASDTSKCIALTAWLEDRHIRQLKVEDRGPLRAGDAAALAAYLEELGAPADVRAAGPVACSFLLVVALGYEFADKREGLAPAPAAAPAPALAADEPALLALAAALGVAPNRGDAFATLQNCTKAARQVSAAARQREGAAAAAAAAAAAPAPAPAPAARRTRKAAELAPLGEATFPLGFGTDDSALDDAARVLRMLYVADLRKLQDAVNTTIVALQEFTANPKTDSRLGRVGH